MKKKKTKKKKHTVKTEKIQLKKVTISKLPFPNSNWRRCSNPVKVSSNSPAIFTLNTSLDAVLFQLLGTPTNIVSRQSRDVYS